MDIRLELISNDNKEIINISDVKNPNAFEYSDSYGAKNLLRIFNNGIDIDRVASTHSTSIKLRENEKSFVTVTSNEGIIKIDIKTLAFERNNGIITLVYSINEEEKAIRIYYIGV